MSGSVPGSEQGRRSSCPHGAHSWAGGKAGGRETYVNKMPRRMKVECLENPFLGAQEGTLGALTWSGRLQSPRTKSPVHTQAE